MQRHEHMLVDSHPTDDHLDLVPSRLKWAHLDDNVSKWAFYLFLIWVGWLAADAYYKIPRLWAVQHQLSTEVPQLKKEVTVAKQNCQ